MRRPLLALLVGLVAVAALPFVARALRGSDGPPRCEYDRVEIDPRYAVRVEETSGARHRFCCPKCAESWLGRERVTPSRVVVIDEDGGSEIDAERAWFVRSDVVAVPATESRLHSFATEEAARRHASSFRGVLVEGADRPFRVH